MEGTTVLLDLISYLKSLQIYDVTNLCREILHSCLWIIRLLLTPMIKLIVDDEGEEGEGDEPPPVEEYCESCGGGGGGGELIGHDDVELVVRSLGMGGFRRRSDDEAGGDGEYCEECRVVEGVRVLLEEKEASLEELEEAFHVFDGDEDGFISPEELRSVLRKLGWEGMKLEDCERMIGVFDEDGDGRIDFSEFKSLLENAG